MIWDIILVLLCGFLGAWAGATGTSLGWRRVGVSLLVGTYLGLFTFAFRYACIPAIFGVLTLGYGRADETDPGSTLFQLWDKILSNAMANVMTRLTIAVLLAIAVIPFAFVPALIFVLIYMFFSVYYLNEGEFKLFGKWLLKEEFIIYAAYGGYAVWLRYIGG